MNAPVLPATAGPVEATAEAFATYQEQARTWEADKMDDLRRSAIRSRLVAAAFGAGFVLATAGAVAAYLRPVERPPVVQIEEATGVASMVPPAVLPSMSALERHTRDMVWRYIEAREGWSWSEDRRNFRRVALMTIAPLQKSFEQWWRGPEGHRAKLSPEGVAELVPIAIELEGPEGRWAGARVRFRKDVTAKRGGETVRTYTAASLDFTWSDSATAVNDLLVNPFGFLVTRYRKDPETPQ